MPIDRSQRERDLFVSEVAKLRAIVGRMRTGGEHVPPETEGHITALEAIVQELRELQRPDEDD